MELSCPRHSYAVLVTLTLFACLAVAIAEPARSAPTYAIRDIGLTDAEHTRDDGQRFNNYGWFNLFPNPPFNSVKSINEAGQVVGHARRFSGNINLGQSVWLYDGTTTLKIGLVDAEHTSDIGFKHSESRIESRINEMGQVVGLSRRFRGGSSDLGESAWLYDGTTTIKIGLTAPEQTRNDGYRYSYVINLNSNGEVIGISDRYNGGADSLGGSAWLFNGSTTLNIGLTDPEHTRNDGYQGSVPSQLNSAGQVIGTSNRYLGGSEDRGYSAWIYSGGTTQKMGFTDAEHTSSNGTKHSEAVQLNEAGMVIGNSARFVGGNDTLRTSAWLYNGATTVNIGLNLNDSHVDRLNEAGHVIGGSTRILGGFHAGYATWVYDGATTIETGLTDAEHTGYNIVTNEYRESSNDLLNQAGQVVGRSARRNGGGIELGYSTWLYDGTTTVKTGLAGAEHTGGRGYQESFNIKLNDAGQVLGYTTRFNGGNPDFGDDGRSVWLYNGATTLNIGLTGAEHTSSDNFKYSEANFLNAAGQVVGRSQRFNGGEALGSDAWVYDPTLGTVPLHFSQRDDGFANSTAAFLGEGGLVLGYYELFDGAASLGQRLFSWSRDEGMHDLGELINGGLDANGWAALQHANEANPLGQIIGLGIATGLPTGSRSAFLLTPNTVVPEPASLVSATLGVVLSNWRRKKSQWRRAVERRWCASGNRRAFLMPSLECS